MRNQPRDYVDDDWIEAASPKQTCALCGASVYQCECPSQAGKLMPQLDERGQRLRTDRKGGYIVEEVDHASR